MNVVPPASGFSVPADIAARQRLAADPSLSAWVSANAGAGKTKVLTDRVLRLLLAGSAPGRILCLTFTKAAAANMAMRVFEKLGQWVTLDEPALRQDLEELTGDAPKARDSRRARTLFARAVETPGGLKIDTIHAFCERLLHLAPFEANVPARFAVLDEDQSAELVAEATANVLSGDDPALASALDCVTVYAAGERLAELLRAALAERAFGETADERRVALARLRQHLGLGAQGTVEAMEKRILQGGITPGRWREIADGLSRGKASDIKSAEAIRSFIAGPPSADGLAQILELFFTKEGRGARRAALCTNSIGSAIRDDLEAELTRIEPLREAWLAAVAVENTDALFTLAQAVAMEVRRQKARLGALDFDDLVEKTAALLDRDENRWVLYKLDRGIDHVLVDEAQDTSARQWRILQAISDDFAAGHGARAGTTRTLFAVGDPKQSIFSFQGADPREFETARRRWSRRCTDTELRFESVTLNLSFRSCTAVLTAVDATFSVADTFQGLAFDDDAVGTVHESARPHVPGLVEVWATEPPRTEPEPDAWSRPLDEPGASSPARIVADRVAAEVKRWIGDGDDDGRRYFPGEILILVRRRGAAFEETIRALRRYEVPVAGADRLDIGQHIAVLDLVAAGRAALLETDDLTLAVALKSPLVGLTEDDLFRIASDRAEDESLATALRRHAAAGDAEAGKGAAALSAWQDVAGTGGPFGFYATLLGPRGARARLVARLGSEAGDAVDAFLYRAHEAEVSETPSLTAFLDRFASAEHVIKRDLDTGGAEVRVMTVHGAKGLEAPIVVIVDDCGPPGRDPPLVPLGAGEDTIPVWTPVQKDDCAQLRQARGRLRALASNESNRLLYVAMTRAADRLVVAPYKTNSKAPTGREWSEKIRNALAAGDAESADRPVAGTLVWRKGPVAVSAPRQARAAEAALVVPDWLHRPLAPEPEPPAPIRPSGLSVPPSGRPGPAAAHRR